MDLKRQKGPSEPTDLRGVRTIGQSYREYPPTGSDPYERRRSLVEKNQGKAIRVGGGEDARTVEVGAVGVDGWDSSDGHVEVGCQSRLMRHRFETLDPVQQPRSYALPREPHLHCSDPFFTLSLGDGPPLAPDARFRTRNSVHSCNEGEEKSQECVLH